MNGISWLDIRLSNHACRHVLSSKPVLLLLLLLWEDTEVVSVYQYWLIASVASALGGCESVTPGAPCSNPTLVQSRVHWLPRILVPSGVGSGRQICLIIAPLHSRCLLPSRRRLIGLCKPVFEILFVDIYWPMLYVYLDTLRQATQSCYVSEAYIFVTE